MTRRPPLTIDRTAATVSLIALSGIVLGLSSAPAALVIGFCALAVIAKAGTTSRIKVVTFWTLTYLLGACMSGIIFGGFSSLGQTSIISWIGNEGRAFLYFWPALFVLEVLRPSEQSLVTVMRILTLIIAANIATQTAVGFSTFGTHHAAGAFSAMMVFYHYFRLEQLRNKTDLIFLGIAILALLGTNSRTSLLAAVLSILVVNASVRNIGRLVTIALALPVLLLLMSSLFPYQFNRLAAAGNATTLSAVAANFQTAFRADTPIEVAKAWDLANQIETSGNANIAIRGYLFGRTSREFVRSPFLGIGYGRVNDLGREFSGVPGLVYPALSAAYSSPSDQTAHNSYLQVLSELGVLGALPLFMVFLTLWRGMRETERTTRMWARTGKASIVCIAIMAMTQHSFGAPIYGLSLFLLAALCYGHLSRRRGQVKVQSG